MTGQSGIERATQAFRSTYYLRHTQRRLEHLASLGLDLHGRSVLEVGAGVGDHTTFFVDRGCAVTSVEPRAENIDLLFQTLSGCWYPPTIKVVVIQAEVEALPRQIKDRFDIVHCYGLLYHTADPALVLDVLAAACDGLLLLETCVSPAAGELTHGVVDDAANPTEAVSGTGCRPTRLWLFNRLKALLGHVYVPKTQPSHEDFPSDWTRPEAAGVSPRAVFIGSRRPLALPSLVDHLPDRQDKL